MKKINVKRLHEVQKTYPNVPKRGGKTTFCFDMLLRSAQTGAYKKISYITNDIKASRINRKEFLQFVWENAEWDLKKVSDKLFSVEVCNCEIQFFGLEDFYNKKREVDAIVEDYF